MINYSIGIVVPVYKVKTEYLHYCVFSLLNQTYRNIRIVLVDDASPDDCGKECDNLACLDNRILVIHHESNKGLPGARNTGIEHMDADWVIFVDADDWIEPNTCELLNKELNTHKADIYIYSGFLNNKNNEFKCSYAYENYAYFRTAEERTMLESRYLLKPIDKQADSIFPIQSACCRMLSMRLFKNKGLRFVDVKFAEDALFHLESTELADSVIYLQYCFYHYRNNGGSMVNSFRPDSDKEQLSFLHSLWEFAETYAKNESFVKQLYYASFISMQMCIWQKYYHPQNGDSSITRRRECKALFRKEPYKSTLKNLNFMRLRSNQKIKYIFIRFSLYGLLVVARSFIHKAKQEMPE